MYLEGLSAEEDIPFRLNDDAQPAGEAAEGAPDGPVTRQVDAGVGVIDLDAMRAELEANPAARVRR